MLKLSLKWFVFAILVVSCSKKEKPPLNGNGDSIIGEQYRNGDLKYPGGIPLFVFLIKLKNPPLLSQVKRDNSGQYFVDENLKDSILKEQSKVIEELKVISPDIKIIYRYKMVLNALAIEAPQSVAGQINQLNLGFIESNEPFNDSSNSHPQNSSVPVNNNIVSFTGADKVHKYFKEKNTDGENFPIKGRGIKVGVIDTGIDYTHSVFGGPGDPDVHKSIDPSKETAFFPTNKVKGGKDFVGDSFSTTTGHYKDQIPAPDNNPMDGDKKDSHGTAVAALIAGKGDGINTQDGIAPEADLYALKIGNDLRTSTMIVLAAMEYAADPNEDTSLKDRLDIINISLERFFGRPHGFYNEAITNLTKAGMLVIAAAGNQGETEESNIVGAPGTANEAISVAASVSLFKNEENYTPAVRFQSSNYPALFSKFKEIKDMTTPVSEYQI